MPRGALPKVYEPGLVNRVASMYASGKTQTEIAGAIGFSQKVVWNLMRRSGIPCRKAAKRDQFGERNHAWKADAAGYQACHVRVENRHGKPMKCEVCGTRDPLKTYDWANLSGKYHDSSDFKRMCRSCHKKFDLARRKESAQ